MKNFETYLQEQEETKLSIRQIETQLKNVNVFREEEKYIALNIQKEKLETFLHYIKQNAYLCVVHENIDKIIETINKYENKKAGEKTRAKLKEELFAINEYIYVFVGNKNIGITSNFQLPYNKQIFNHNDININIVYDKSIINQEKKYCKVYKDDFNLCKNNIILNYEEFYQKMIDDKKELEKMTKDLQDKLNDYNKNSLSMFEDRKSIRTMY